MIRTTALAFFSGCLLCVGAGHASAVPIAHFVFDDSNFRPAHRDLTYLGKDVGITFDTLNIKPAPPNRILISMEHVDTHTDLATFEIVMRDPPLQVGTFVGSSSPIGVSPNLLFAYDHFAESNFTADFTISRYEYSGTYPNWVLQRFEATFTLHRGTRDVPGSISYNAVPEPSTLALAAIGVIGLFAVRRRHAAL